MNEEDFWDEARSARCFYTERTKRRRPERRRDGGGREGVDEGWEWDEKGASVGEVSKSQLVAVKEMDKRKLANAGGTRT